MRHLSRMPTGLQERHALWTVRRASLPDLERGRALATVTIAAGDDPEVVERQLLALGMSPDAAVQATAAALTS